MLPPGYFEILVEELRPEFGSSDPFVAVALRDHASSLSDEATPESLVLSENHLREAISILESHPDEKLERVKAMIDLGNFLKRQGKSLQQMQYSVKQQKALNVKLQAKGSNSENGTPCDLSFKNRDRNLNPAANPESLR